MKTISENRAVRAAATLAALLLGIFSAASQTQFPSPSGMWDCTVSGGRGGLAYLNFYDDFTFEGVFVVVPAPRKSSSSFDSSDRNPGYDTGRDPTVTVTPPGEAKMKIFGAEQVTGPWGFDSSGRFIGYFVETVSSGNCTTNLTVTSISETNGSTVTVTYYTNVVIDCPGITNAISFIGKTSPGRSLTMVCSSPDGKIQFKGVPARTLKDLSGSWYGLKRTANKRMYWEFFTLTPSFEAAAFPNIYDLNGNGPGYGFSGIVMLSAHGRIAVATSSDSDGSLRATVGPFSGRTMSGTTKGWDQPSGTATNYIQFDLKQQVVY